jgi:dihydrofolate reductase
MIISIIAALDKEFGIGIDNKMPWHLPLDLKRFRKITMGHHLILGRKTFQSIGGPLPGRQMIILTRNPDFKAEDCLTSNSLAEAYQLAAEAGEKEVFVIGGGEVYQQALPDVERLYLTQVDTVVKADTNFPVINETDWSVICEQSYSADKNNPLAHTFRYMVRESED